MGVAVNGNGRAPAGAVPRARSGTPHTSLASRACALAALAASLAALAAACCSASTWRSTCCEDV